MEMKFDNVDAGRPFDWGRTSEDYARYRDIYPPVFYEKILNRNLCQKGQRVLDLATGTGVLPRNLYARGARWTGTDISAEQIAQAKRLSRAQNMNIEYLMKTPLPGPVRSWFSVIVPPGQEPEKPCIPFPYRNPAWRALRRFTMRSTGWMCPSPGRAGTDG